MVGFSFPLPLRIVSCVVDDVSPKEAQDKGLLYFLGFLLHTSEHVLCPVAAAGEVSPNRTRISSLDGKKSLKYIFQKKMVDVFCVLYLCEQISLVLTSYNLCSKNKMLCRLV